MNEIPTDAKIIIAQFWAEQKAEEQIRAQKCQEQFSKRERDDCAQRKAMTAKEVQKYARNYGLQVETGKGKHGVHLIASNGQECPLPVHGRGRSLATGTQRSIVSFIQQNGTNKG